jgi:hypothetical protein
MFFGLRLAISYSTTLNTSATKVRGMHVIFRAKDESKMKRCYRRLTVLAQNFKVLGIQLFANDLTA